LTDYSGGLEMPSDRLSRMRQFVQNRLRVLEAVSISLLLLVFLIPVGPVMLLEIPVASDMSVSKESCPQARMSVQGAESITTAESPVSLWVQSYTSWELAEEEAIVELYVAHYEATSKQPAEASISSSGPSRQGFEGQTGSVTGISSGSSGGLVIDFVDRGAMWLVSITQIFTPIEAGRRNLISLSYYSIRQGYSNPDVAGKISLIAKVRGFSV